MLYLERLPTIQKVYNPYIFHRIWTASDRKVSTWREAINI